MVKGDGVGEGATKNKIRCQVPIPLGYNSFLMMMSI